MTMQLTEHGKEQIRNFILLNHIHGRTILLNDYTLGDWYAEATQVYNSGMNFPTICIEAKFSKQTQQDIYQLIPDQWMMAGDTRIGVNDQVRPDLMGKKIRDWG